MFLELTRINCYTTMLFRLLRLHLLSKESDAYKQALMLSQNRSDAWRELKPNSVLNILEHGMSILQKDKMT
jgi:hypothetical protein